MQTVPAFHNILRLSTQELAAAYKRSEWITWLLENVGLVGGTSAAAAGVAEGLKSGSLKQGIGRTASRLVGKGAISEALIARHGAGAPARAGGIAVTVGLAATLVHQSGKMQMAEIRARMQHEFQSGRAKPEEYRTVFGGTVDPSAIRKYWEYGR